MLGGAGEGARSVGGLKEEILRRGLGQAESLRPLLIYTGQCASLSSASPRRSRSGKTGIVARCGPHL